MPKQSQLSLIRQFLGKTPVTALDIETTGLLKKTKLPSGAPYEGVIVEIGMARARGMGQTINKYQAFVDPHGQGQKISKEYITAYQESQAFLSHQINIFDPAFAGKIEKVGEVQKKLAAMIPKEGVGLVVGHNIRDFDLRMIQERLGFTVGLHQKTMIADTLEMSRRALPKLTDYKLPTIANALGIKHVGPMHRALSDAELSLEIFWKLAADRRYSKRSGIGDIIKAVWGNQAFDQSRKLVEQTYWEGSGTKRRVMETVDPISFMGTVNTVKRVEDRATGEKFNARVSAQGEVERAYADAVVANRMIRGGIKEEIKEQRRVRDLEEWLFRGEHSPETLNLAKRIAPEMSLINPIDLRKKFITDVLGYTESVEERLRSGDAGKSLREAHAARMAEYLVTGKLARTGFRGKTTGVQPRIVSFGDYAMSEAGSFYLGSLPSGKDVFIELAQQKALIDEMFGVTSAYRLTGTGKIATYAQMSNLRVTAPPRDIAAAKKLYSKEKVRKYIEAEIEREVPLASREAGGWVDPMAATIVDPYSYSVGKPGKRKGVPRMTEEEEFAAMTREAIEGSSPGRRRMEVEEAALAEGRDPFFSDSAEEILQETKNAHIAYIDNAKYHTKRLDKLRRYRHEGFLYKWLEPVLSMKERRKLGRGKVKKVEKFMGFKPKFEQLYEQGVEGFLYQHLNLAGKTPEEISEALGKIKSGASLKVLVGKKYQTITAEDIKLSTLALQYLSEDTAHFFASKARIPSRALAEKVFPIYFKRVKGQAGFAAYTEAGTLLGVTSRKYQSGQIVPKAYAKIFKGTTGYEIGWSKSRRDFYWNRFGAVEEAINIRRASRGLDPKKEISSIWDLERKNRLWTTIESQDLLARLYNQEGEDYKLISKYKLDRATNTYIDIETGKVVDKAIADVYRSKAERVYLRHAKWREIFGRGRAKTVSAAGKIDELLAGKAFAGRGKNLVYGAMVVSAALISLTAFSSKRRVMDSGDVARQPYGSTTDDQRMFGGNAVSRSSARISPDYSGRQGYTTNIDVNTNDPGGVDHREVARVMDHHARNTLGVSRGSVNMEINDNSDNSSDRSRKRKYQSMLRS